MIVTQEIARIAQALLKDSTYSLVEARWQTLTPLNLTPGQMVQAEVLANLPDSRYLIRLANQLLRMEIPLNLQPGQTVELTFVSEEPRLVFALSKEANSGVPVRISDTGRWLNQLATSRNDATQSTPLPRPSIILQEPPRDTGRLAEGLRNALTRSGVFYESHLSQWVKGERPLADLLREPQGSLSRLAVATTSGGSNTSPAPAYGGTPPQQNAAPPASQSPGGPPAAATDAGQKPAAAPLPAANQPTGSQPAAGGGGNAPSTAPDSAATGAAGSPGSPPGATPATGDAPRAAHQPGASAPSGTTAPAGGTPATDQTPPPSRPGGNTSALPDADPTAQRPQSPAPDGTRPPMPQDPLRPDSTPVAGKPLPVPSQPDQPSPQGPPLRQAPPSDPAVQNSPAAPGTTIAPQAKGERIAVDQHAASQPRAPMALAADGDGVAVAARAGDPVATERAGGLRHIPPPPQGGVEPQTIPIIKEQLTTLATGQFTWNGQVWPGQDMEWKVEEREADGRGSSAERSWQTEVALDLPRLGSVRATLSLGSSGVTVNLAARNEETVATMKEGRPRLEEALDAAGIRMTGFRVSHDDE
ncbi:flagellar hook-length control protein FliK [Geobacter sulfurreducens]|uniref:flagellar hook-length control protein FliK n=1 Tax=Geobacter sulfurreducens TaxID=35554 RepID=UPI002C3780C4|nr:flagellar hook-length control protein FliK [Geobacter sulfurreducens]HML77619.1 flagellar hook-length control protein FliK [Geobacter sulfurreducens]